MISITLTYLCQSAVCWAVLLAFYELCLRKSTHYHLSRLYLLSALILGAAIPLLPNYFTQAPEFVYTFQGSLEEFVVVVDNYTAPQVEQLFDWTIILQSFYVIISAVLLFRIAFGVYKITLIKPLEITRQGAIEINFHQENIQPFSFLNKIFIPKDYPKKYQQIVLAHEMSHVKQGHSIDIIVSRTMAAIFWINPMVRYFELYLKEVHEHFADQYILMNYDLKTYQGALRFSAFSSVGLRMAHAFNSNNIRNRLRKMKKSNSTISTKFLYVAILPIAVFLSMAMNTYDGDVLKSALYNITENTGKLLTTSSSEIKADIIHVNAADTVPPPPPPPPPPTTMSPPPPPPMPSGQETKTERQSLQDILPDDKPRKLNLGLTGTSHRGFGDALIVIDGKVIGQPGSLPTALSPDDIETIDVLKGDAAYQHYGKLAQNGVVRIRTKKGSKSHAMFSDLNPAMVTSSSLTSTSTSPPSASALTKENLLHSKVDEMPRFPGCEDRGSLEEIKNCASNNLIQYLSNEIRYPESAKRYGVDGVVLIQFTVTSIGRIRDAIVSRDIGHGCGEEALRVVNLMNEKVGNWTPGRKNGEAVHVQFNLPIKFKMDGDGSVVEKTLITADEMPRFPGCESLPIHERESCAKKNLLTFIYKNITYPHQAKVNNIEGAVVIEFVVKTDGSIADAKLVKNIGGGCGDESLRVVNLMNQERIRWTPGVHDGRPVNVKYTLPIHFKLESNSASSDLKDGQGDEVYKIVQEKPRFPGCEDIVGSQTEKEACATKTMLEFLYTNIQYPEIAKSNNTEGTTVIQFIVEKDGSISNAKIVRDVKDGCGAESLRVVNSMNHMPKKWIPGKQNGRVVRVQYNLPVKFKLTDDHDDKKENKVIGEF